MFEWFRGISEQYGVDPLIFALIYLLTLPAFTMSIGWIVRRLLLGRSVVVPSLFGAFFYLASYLYIFAVGRNIPLWFYALVLLIIGVGSTFTIMNIRKRAARIKPQDTTHDLIVIGGGAAGLTAAGIGASLGARTLLVERSRLGGDCTWDGCIPSKTLLRSAKAVHERRHGARFGLSDDEAHEVDFARVMQHLRSVREKIYEEADRPEVMRGHGVEVQHGHACFLDPNTIEIEDADGKITTATGRYVIIATGARPVVPDIPGIDEIEYFTSRTIFDIEEQPECLLIVGAGPIGIEMAQAFQRLGSDVTVIDQLGCILSRDEPEQARALQHRLEEEGVRFLLSASVEQVCKNEEGEIDLHIVAGGARRIVTGDALLMATGRQPNVGDMRLEAAGVDHTRHGVTVDENCRTNRRPVFAAGDVAGRSYFTHVGEHMAKTAVVNALLKYPQKMDTAHIPWATYTDPELAHVGWTRQELEERAAKYETYRFPYHKLDRAVTEGTEEGCIIIHATRWRGRILGASVLGDRAGELISELAVAMRQGISLRQLSDTIHPYPTFALGVRRAADQWYIRKQRPAVIRYIQRIFGYRGKIVERDPDEVV